MDVVLAIKKKGLPLFKRDAIVLIDPADASAKDGRYRTKPDTWGADIPINQLDVARIKSWLADCLGKSLVKVIAAHAAGQQEIRLIVTADESSREALITAPWEVLAVLDEFLTAGLQVHVVRVIKAHEQSARDRPIERLTVAVTYANPYDDIPNIQQHLDQLKSFFQRQSDLLELSGPHEFTSTDSVAQALSGQHPDALYHIGHAVQEADSKVHLVIGSRGNATGCDVVAFRKLVHETGVRVLLVNSCAAMSGVTLNPYLGVAGICGEQIEGVISMQTLVPVDAAIAFAEKFFLEVSKDRGLASSVTKGRFAVAAAESCEQVPFSRFIPVQLQQTPQDRPLRVDVDGRELGLLLKSLEGSLERIATYLCREHDESLKQMLTDSPHRVVVIHGDPGTGKSTSLRNLLTPLLNEELYRNGDRWLYYDFETNQPGAGSAANAATAHQLLDMLLSFVASFRQTSRLSWQLKRGLDRKREQKVDWAVDQLAAWLDEEQESGRSYCLCFDNVPPEVASAWAVAASSRVSSGRIVIATSRAEVHHNAPVSQLKTELMNDAELEQALLNQGLPHAATDVKQLADAAGRFPLLVVAYLKRGIPAAISADPIQTFLSQQQLSLAEEEVLQFAAHCQAPIPSRILEQHWNKPLLDALALESHLLIQKVDDRYQLPSMLRAHFQQGASDPVAIHRRAYHAFDELAVANLGSYAQDLTSRVNEWFYESFQHAIQVVEIADDADPELSNLYLEQALETARVLHSRLVVRRGEVARAKAVWERYMDAAQSQKPGLHREAEYHYAAVLHRIAQYTEAEAHLQMVTLADEEEDELRLRALHLYSNLLKTRAEEGDFEHRIELLEAATELGRLLHRDHGIDSRSEVAELELSLGNAYSYGRLANPELATRHFRKAQNLFQQLNDLVGMCRSRSEEIGMRRHNELLSAAERTDVINELTDNLRDLVMAGARRDRLYHLYELGRLEIDAAQRAKWFAKVAELARGAFEPMSIHAAIHARTCEVEARLKTFPEVADGVEQRAVVLLDKWMGNSWSRRVARNAFEFLAKSHEGSEQWAQALKDWKRCVQVTRLIYETRRGSESPKDRERRLAIAERCRRLAERLNDEQVAKEASELAADEEPPTPGRKRDRGDVNNM